MNTVDARKHPMTLGDLASLTMAMGGADEHTGEGRVVPTGAIPTERTSAPPTVYRMEPES